MRKRFKTTRLRPTHYYPVNSLKEQNNQNKISPQKIFSFLIVTISLANLAIFFFFLNRSKPDLDLPNLSLPEHLYE